VRGHEAAGIWGATMSVEVFIWIIMGGFFVVFLVQLIGNIRKSSNPRLPSRELWGHRVVMTMVAIFFLLFALWLLTLPKPAFWLAALLGTASATALWIVWSHLRPLK